VVVAVALLGIVAAAFVPIIIGDVIDAAVAGTTEGHLARLAGLALLLGVVDCGLAVVRRLVTARASAGLERDLRDALYEHLQRLHVGFHDGWQSGQLLSRAMGDLSTIRRFIGFGSVFLLVCTGQLALVLALLLRLDVPLALLTAAAIAPIAPLSAAFRKRYGEVSRRVQDQQGDLTTTIEESLLGIRVIKAFRRGDEVARRFEDEARGLRATALEGVRLRSFWFVLMDVVPNLTVALVLALGALAVASGRMTVGELVAFVGLVAGLVWPVEALGWILANLQEATTASQRVWEILDAEPTIVDGPMAHPLPRVRGELRLEGVGFRYGDDEPWVLRGVDLVVRPGETVAIVGATASGKTTLLSLVARLHDPTEGRVTLDGHDLRHVRLAELRQQVAVAFEDPLLFSASVRENLLVGHAARPDDELWAALDVAQAGFVRDLPWGLETRVGEQGLSLSGGQRQRLALARAVLGRPRVLVLDDPLSALDVHTEALVEDALRRVLADATGLVVVHRPSTVALADRVAFLQGGRIAAVGTHAHLLATVPAYRDVLAQDAERGEAVA
jgi:ATP-binding cassette subfamily B protein